MAPKLRIIETQYEVVPHELLLGIESDVPFQREALEGIVEALPESGVRAKGVIYLQEEPERRFTLQVMVNRWNLTPGILWVSEKPESHLVFIGVQGQFDPAELSMRLEECTEKTRIQGRSK